MRNLLMAGCIALSLFSCEKKAIESSGKFVEIYLLDTFQTHTNSYYGMQIIDSTVHPENSALIYYDQILFYDKTNHCFILNENEVDIEYIRDFLPFKAFAVTVDKEVIYTGYFWPSYASSICYWVTCDPLSLYNSNKLNIRLGYPMELTDDPIPDMRNDERILSVFRKDNKLIE